ncbi:hypothetical protein [Parasitella parasitica]|uniref:Uncharacterized protein n=1 Tax=Parasitella parasitica TaxID=35722 RepID=A0A0B7NJQ2_9FUNG|nr:hypothetical protein [Parasitella parasitica]
MIAKNENAYIKKCDIDSKYDAIITKLGTDALLYPMHHCGKFRVNIMSLAQMIVINDNLEQEKMRYRPEI